MELKKLNLKNLNSAANAVQADKQEEMTKKYFELIKRIESFAELKKDWDTFDSDPPGEIAIKNAITALGYCQRRFPDAINPNGEPGVTFEYFKTNYFFVIEFYNTGEIGYLKTIDDVIVDNKDITINEVEQVIKTVIGEIL